MWLKYLCTNTFVYANLLFIDHVIETTNSSVYHSFADAHKKKTKTR